METNQKLNVLFYLNKQRTKDGETPIYARIYVDGKKSEFNTNHKIRISDWNTTTKRVKSTARNALLINTYLEEVKNQITKLFLLATTTGEPVNSVTLKNRLLGKTEASKEKTICDAFDYHNTKMAEMVESGKVTRKTLLRYKSSKKKLIKFMKREYNVSDKPLKELRLSYITEFDHYLLTVENLQSNTAHKIIKTVKKIMNLAVTLDWIPSSPFNQFKCTYKNPERVVLTEAELETLKRKKLHIPRLIEVRDVFIFQCYTGFAYTDLYNFKRNDVTIGIDGKRWLTAYRQKTGTKENVPLLSVALDIIEKYKDHPDCIENDKLLPVNSNYCYNAYLKEIAEICNIKKKITTHIARHTFATTVTLSNGVPIETVSKMLGHTRLATTQIYAKVLEKKVSDDMNILQDKLNGLDEKLAKVSSS